MITQALLLINALVLVLPAEIVRYAMSFLIPFF